MTEYYTIDLELAEQALSFIHADVRETWVQMAMALKSEFGDAGFDAWNNWSATAGNYNASTARSVWKSVKGHGGVTIATLIHEAQQNGFELKPDELSEKEKVKRKIAADKKRKQREKEWKLQEEETRFWHEQVSKVSIDIWENYLSDSGKSDYLNTKKVRAFGIKFVTQAFVLITDKDGIHNILTGKEVISEFFERIKPEDRDSEDRTHFKYFKYGSLAVPLRDETGKLWNLQFIRPTGNKTFLTHGKKQGCYHIIGEVGSTECLMTAEGYATGASLHQATGHPVAITFDCGNLKAVAQSLRHHFPDLPMVICGDDDIETTGNPGRTKALEAAELINGVAVFPTFEAQEAA